jgi:hypothetical protein
MALWQLQETPKLDETHLSPMPKGKGKGIYQSISSAFSRLSYPVASSPKSTSSPGQTEDHPKPSTSDYPSSFLGTIRKRQ